MATEERDAGIAVLISILGLLFLFAPAVGYFYLGKVRKGLIYWAIGWILPFLLLFLFLVFPTILGAFTGGIGYLGFCCFPLAGVLYLALYVMIIYDVYLVAKGKKERLPG